MFFVIFGVLSILRPNSSKETELEVLSDPTHLTHLRFCFNFAGLTRVANHSPPGASASEPSVPFLKTYAAPARIQRL